MSNPSTPSLGSSSTLTSEDNLLPSQSHTDVDLYSSSPLAQSLIAFSCHPNCPADLGFFDNVAEDNQPRQLAFMPDTADYFVDNDGQPILLVFPAELDFEGKYSRAGSYFNLSTSPDIVDLRKARAQFELRLLNNVDCPEIAVRASTSAYETCVVLFSEVETYRNGSLPASQRPSVTPFWRTYEESGGYYTLVVQTPPLFSKIPNLKDIPVPKITRRQVGLSSVPPSPAKLIGKQSTTTSSSSTSRGIHEWKLADLADPEGRYSKLAATVRRDTTINVPDIRDGNGTLIHPQYYSSQLQHGAKVVVEVMLKLWNIRAPDKTKPAIPSKWKAREGDANGSRNYQLVLTKMQLLPVVDISKAIISIPIASDQNRKSTITTDSSKALPQTQSTVSQGKRKAVNANRKAAKKRVVDDPLDEGFEMVAE